MHRYYAGIGSRATPPDVQLEMESIARTLHKKGLTLRSGGAGGADKAFERGAGRMQIFLPWNDFNGRKADGVSYIVPEYDDTYTKLFHPRPDRLNKEGLLYMSRNANQVLGPNLDEPSDFVVCWTEDGKASGGTGQAIRIANSKNIPVFNLKNGSSDLFTFLNFNYS